MYNAVSITLSRRGDEKSICCILFLLIITFPYLKRTRGGIQTSNRKPKIKSAAGQLLQPTDAGFDPSPMAVRYAKDPNDPQGTILLPGNPSFNNPGNEHYVRFTDYTLDGAAKNVYFYYGIELSNRMQYGPRSVIAGPIQLVNTDPAEAPEIRWRILRDC